MRPFPTLTVLAVLIVSMLIDLGLMYRGLDDPIVTWGVILAVVGYAAVRSSKRRRALRAFASQHGLRFVGLSRSDARSPFTRFGSVASAVLLFNVVEGRWEGLETAVFEMRRRARPTISAAIVEIPGDGTTPWVPPYNPEFGGSGTSAGAELDAAGRYLLFAADRVLTPDELTSWLTRAVSLAKAGGG